jgi:hypothetical protein
MMFLISHKLSNEIEIPKGRTTLKSLHEKSNQGDHKTARQKDNVNYYENQIWDPTAIYGPWTRNTRS